MVAFSGRREGETLRHDVPPLVVRRTVPEVPETQTILSDTGDRPRNCWVLFVGVRDQARGSGLGWLDARGIEASRRVSNGEDLGSIMVAVGGEAMKEEDYCFA